MTAEEGICSTHCNGWQPHVLTLHLGLVQRTAELGQQRWTGVWTGLDSSAPGECVHASGSLDTLKNEPQIPLTLCCNLLGGRHREVALSRRPRRCRAAPPACEVPEMLGMGAPTCQDLT